MSRRARVAPKVARGILRPGHVTLNVERNDRAQISFGLEDGYCASWEFDASGIDPTSVFELARKGIDAGLVYQYTLGRIALATLLALQPAIRAGMGRSRGGSKKPGIDTNWQYLAAARELGWKPGQKLAYGLIPRVLRKLGMVSNEKNQQRVRRALKAASN